jgi:putative nucleotidyltransferase with HDIG domain
MYNLSLKEMVVSLLESIDIVNFLLKHHHQRVAAIAYQIAKEMNLDDKQVKRVVLGAALHDIGALHVKERDELIEMDTRNPYPHAVRGALMLKSFDYFEPISDIILHHHRYWDFGDGAKFSNRDVPIESFVIHLADRIEILLRKDVRYIEQVDTVIEKILKRKGSIFEDTCVDAFESLSKKESFWLSIDGLNLNKLLMDCLKHEKDLEASLDVIEKFSMTLSNIVDFRSQFTATHSLGVSMVAYTMARIKGYSEEKCREIKIAGLLHDLGKIGVPVEMVEKNTQLSQYEFDVMKSHAYFTNQILDHVKGLENIKLWASMHHEKRDGQGYPFHITEKDFTEEMDILILADIFTALSENRPYRKGMELDYVKSLIQEKYEGVIDQNIYDLLFDNMEELDIVRYVAQRDAYKLYSATLQEVNKLLLHPEIRSQVH